ncbi:MAG: hypothetical protein QXS06_00025 [Desulfurococcaceae archaeon]
MKYAGICRRDLVAEAYRAYAVFLKVNVVEVKSPTKFIVLVF